MTDAVVWLAGACRNPVRVLREWESDPRVVPLARVGVRFDVVEVGQGLGLAAFRALGGRGPVLHCPGRGVVWFLVPVGAAAGWRAAGVRGLAGGEWIPVPHPEWGGGRVATWLRPPGAGAPLVRPEALRAAVGEAGDGAEGWREAVFEESARRLLGAARERALAAWLPGRSERSPGEARRLVRVGMEGWGVADASADAVQLVVSELVTNSVRHTRSPCVGLSVVMVPRWVRVAVRDTGPGFRARVAKAGNAEEGGRGLELVEGVAARWGCRRLASGAGAVTWARVAVGKEAGRG
ncbi:hypothetical protein GCM10027168_07450 [Streptomyces capparidis]